ncbi:MAG: DAK2 domain-containing protein [Chloroflexota bacterium]|nr:DAK2 domain-containing protein [Chloroflexota bacterium]
MSTRTGYGAATLVAFRAAAANLETHLEEINALNVFPVPDGDTGTNMLATVRSALAEAESVPLSSRTLPRVAAAISFGALMGARGNSGVILSQIFRGMVEVGRERRIVNGLDLAYGLRRGSETAYAAIARPVEGTILTVIRETADAAVEAAERDPALEAVLAAAVEAAGGSVSRTPSLLPILREAGVVDSGGQGLFRLLEGALASMRGETIAVSIAARPVGRASPVTHTESDGWGYETMFLVSADGPALDLQVIRRELEGMGDSVLVAGDTSAAKVHVHNDRPDQVIAYGLTQGRLSRITVENLDDQALDVAEARAQAFTGVKPRSVGATNGSSIEETRKRDAVPKDAVALLLGRPHAGDDPSKGSASAVVVVAAGMGLARALESTGAPGALLDSRAGNPSAGDLLAAMRATGAREIVILPNDPDIRLAARLAARLASGLVVKVVPTRTGPEGVAAMLAFDPARSAADNAKTMLAAAHSVRTLSVTQATRDARFGERRVRKGQTIVLDADEGLVAAHRHRLSAAVAGVATLQPGFELLTVYYGEGADLSEAEELAQRLAESLEGVEVQILHGGQLHYSYLIAAE